MSLPCLAYKLRATHLLADFRCIASRQLDEIVAQSARVENPLIALSFKLSTKQNIFTKRHVLDPRLLRHIRHTIGANAAHAAVTVWYRVELAGDGGEKRRFAGANLATDGDKLAG